MGALVGMVSAATVLVDTALVECAVALRAAALPMPASRAAASAASALRAGGIGRAAFVHGNRFAGRHPVFVHNRFAFRHHRFRNRFAFVGVGGGFYELVLRQLLRAGLDPLWLAMD